MSNASAAAIAPSAPCWSQPRLVIELGVISATLLIEVVVDIGLASGEASWAEIAANDPNVSIATRAVTNRYRIVRGTRVMGLSPFELVPFFSRVENHSRAGLHRASYPHAV